MRTILILAATALAVTLAPVRTEAPRQDALHIVGTAEGEEGDAFAFSAAHRPPAGAVVTYFWEFGDGTPGMSGPHMSAVSHRFMQDGTYTVTVRTAGGGGAGTASFEVTVEAKAPVIEALSLQGLAVPGTPTLFQAAASDPGDDPLVYTWDFGDGTPPRSGEDLVELEHVYAQGGHYTVTLTVTDEDGLEARQTLDVVANPGFLGALAGEVDLPVVGESGKATLYNALPGQRAFRQTPLFTGAAPMHAGVADLRDAAGICLVAGGFWDDEHRVHVNFSWTPAADSVFIPKTYPINWRQRQGSDRLESGQMMVNAMVLGIEPSYEDTKKGAETMAVVPPVRDGVAGAAIADVGGDGRGQHHEREDGQRHRLLPCHRGEQLGHRRRIAEQADGGGLESEPEGAEHQQRAAHRPGDDQPGAGAAGPDRPLPCVQQGLGRWIGSHRRHHAAPASELPEMTTVTSRTSPPSISVPAARSWNVPCIRFAEDCVIVSSPPVDTKVPRFWPCW